MHMKLALCVETEIWYKSVTNHKQYFYIGSFKTMVNDLESLYMGQKLCFNISYSLKLFIFDPCIPFSWSMAAISEMLYSVAYLTNIAYGLSIRFYENHSCNQGL